MQFIKHIRHLVRFTNLPRRQRRLVFYSEGKQYWVHMAGIIQHLLAHYDIPLCYFSSAEDDPGLSLEHPNYLSFKVDSGWVRNWLFESIDTDVMVMTMPDLHQYQIKRSRHAVHYVYVQHSLVSLHMAYRKGAFDHFDTIFCSGPHHVDEVRAIETQGQLKEKQIIRHGYGRLDAIIQQADLESSQKINRDQLMHVLLAPSWGPNGVIETMGSEIVNELLAAGFKVTLRPHPQTTRFCQPLIQRIAKQHATNQRFELELNVSGQESLHLSDIMISDWSGAALEYAFGLGKPVIFIDTPKKVNNPDYAELAVTPLEELIRDKIGRIVQPSAVKTIKGEITSLLAEQNNNRALASENVFNLGQSDKVGAEAIYQLLQQQAKAHP